MNMTIAPPKKTELIGNVDSTLEWLQAGFCVIKSHWNQIDYHRMNKFLYLVRVLVLQGLKYLEEKKFKRSAFTEWNQILNATLLDESSLGNFYWFLD